MASFTVNPIFVVREICDLDLAGISPDLRGKIEKVTVGREQPGSDVCSMNTKPMLVVLKEDFNANQLEELRGQLIKAICKEKLDGQAE